MRLAISPDERWTAIEHEINTIAVARHGVPPNSQSLVIWLVQRWADSAGSAFVLD